MAKYSSKIIHCSETLISCKAQAGAGPYQLQSQHIAEWRVERTDCSVSLFCCGYCKIPTSEFPSCFLPECQFIIQMELWHISVKKSDIENKLKRVCCSPFKILLGREGSFCSKPRVVRFLILHKDRRAQIVSVPFV